MTEPLFAANQLVLPQGTHLKGSVLQVQPARTIAAQWTIANCVS